jgi:adaptin ear-binding coat-associated protein 1/2
MNQADLAASSTNNNNNNNNNTSSNGTTADDPTAPAGTGESSLLRQTLLSFDEVFVYKIPPLTVSGGHRAEDWDLANPLQTCGFQVERRGNDLFLIFTTESHTKIFALAKYLPGHAKSVEPVVDSSRYFVTSLISSDVKKKAWIGFGFRNREAALDLLGVLQQFSKSIEREVEAKQKVDQAQQQLNRTSLQAGDKIHIVFGSKEKSSIVKNSISTTTKAPKSTSQKKEDGIATSTTSPRGGLLLLKKPPGYHSQEENGKVEASLEQNSSLTPPPSTGVPQSTDSEAAVAGTSIEGDLDFGDDNEDKQAPLSAPTTTPTVTQDTSTAAVVDDEDDWNDFQGA